MKFSFLMAVTLLLSLTSYASEEKVDRSGAYTSYNFDNDNGNGPAMLQDVPTPGYGLSYNGFGGGQGQGSMSPPLVKHNTCTSFCKEKKDEIKIYECREKCNEEFKTNNNVYYRKLLPGPVLSQCEMSDDQMKITCPQGEYIKSSAVNNLEGVTKDLTPHTKSSEGKKFKASKR